MTRRSAVDVGRFEWDALDDGGMDRLEQSLALREGSRPTANVLGRAVDVRVIDRAVGVASRERLELRQER